MIHPKPMIDQHRDEHSRRSVLVAPYRGAGPAEPLQTEDEQDRRREITERGPIVGHEPSPSVSD